MTALSLAIGLRYTRAKRRNHFISFISLVSIIGIALGMVVLITVLSVMNGFDTELKEKILGSSPHVTVYGAIGELDNWQERRQQLLAMPKVVSATPFVSGQGMLMHQSLTHFALIQGIVPDLENAALQLNAKLRHGTTALKAGQYQIILGRKLALSLAASVGDKLTLLTPETTVSLAGIMPRVKRFTVAGIINLGTEYDNTQAYIHLQDAQKLYHYQDRVSGLNLRTKNLYQAHDTAVAIRSNDTSLFTTDWTIQNGDFFRAVKQEKTMMFLLLTFIILVATFNILATLIMLVTEKQADIAILRTLGASKGLIMRIFMVQGLFIGCIGTIIGVAGGLLLASHVSEVVSWLEQVLNISLISSEVYYVNFLPSEIHCNDVLSVAGIGLVMSLIFTLYPAWRASQLEITEALRYE